MDELFNDLLMEAGGAGHLSSEQALRMTAIEQRPSQKLYEGRT